MSRPWAGAAIGGGAGGLALAAGVVLAVRSASPTAVAVLGAGGLVVAAVGLRTSAAALRGADPDEQDRHLPGHLGYPCACADPRKRRMLGRIALGTGIVALSGLPALWWVGRRLEPRLRRTAWQDGVRVVDGRGVPVRVDDLELGSFTTVWPEGGVGAGDAQAVLVRLREGRVLSGAGRTEWTVEGHAAFSKLCTHMGCPVGLYQTESDVLVCPCHQAMFDVLRGCEPIHGPASRPLPQLPLGLDVERYLVATGDFPDPVGPGFWERPS